MLIETCNGHHLNADKIVDYQIGLAEDDKGDASIIAEVDGWRGKCVIARFDTEDLAPAGMRRLARLLAEPGRGLITQDDICRESADIFSGGNWVGCALLACVRRCGGKLHLSADDMNWRADDGFVRAVHGQDGSVSFDWEATTEGWARQLARNVYAAPLKETPWGVVSDPEEPKSEPSADDAADLKYRLGWRNDKGERRYDAPEDDADFDTVKATCEHLRASNSIATGMWDVGVYLVEEDGSLTLMED